MATTCAYDSGSMYDCQPLCSKPATDEIVTAGMGGYKGYTIPLCKRHLSPMKNRVYPESYTVRPLN